MLRKGLAVFVNMKLLCSFKITTLKYYDFKFEIL